MSSRITQNARPARPWALACAALLMAAPPASAQLGYGGYGGYNYGYGYGYGYGGYGLGYGVPAYGYGGVGFVNPGFGAGYGYGYGTPAFGYGGYPFQSGINAANLGYGNTLGLGLVPPAYVGTGTAGLGPIGIGGINPLFGLGLSPLAVHNAVAEQALRARAGGNSFYYRGYSGQPVRLNFETNRTLPNSYTNETIPGAASAVPR